MGTALDLPIPPLTSTETPPVLSGAAITIEFIDGTTLPGSLLSLDQQAGALVFSSQGKQLTYKFDKIKIIQINAPLQYIPDAVLNPSQANNPTQPYHIIFKDNTDIEGETYGFKQDKYGLHIFKRHSNNPYIQEYIHIYIPQTNILNQNIGKKLGEILSSEKLISSDDLNHALQEQHQKEALGQVLVRQKIVNEKQLSQALAHQRSLPQMRLGEILISEGLVSEQQLDDALAEQKGKQRRPLGEILINMGLVSRTQIQQALAKKLGIPFVHIQEFSIKPETLKLLPAELVYKHKVIPLYAYDNKIVVALENPLAWEALDTLRFHTNKHIEAVMALEEDIVWALQFYYSSDELLHSIEELDTQLPAIEEEEIPEASDLTADNIVVKMVNKIILDAYQQGVSDIHIEPYPDKSKTVVRFRRDGILHTYHEFPPQYRAAFISRIKIMAKLDISERRKPQDGKINFKKFGNANIELRVATLPTAGGLEDVVMRILSSGKAIPINALGLNPSLRDSLLQLIDKPYGLFLVCGPTGSGKTTTLHSIMGQLNDSEHKIWTAEDPVEITQVGLRQVQVNPKIGLDFATAMRAFLRADPDIIMVGEMRDTETAAMAIEASLTGHLVLSTLHTNTAVDSLIRLLEMGMNPFNFADALLGILAQRLAKTLCQGCKKPYAATTEKLHFLAEEFCEELIPVGTRTEDREIIINQQISIWQDAYANSEGQIMLYRPVGCDQCADTGYRGRIGLHELMVASRDIKDMMLSHSRINDIQRQALSEGMRTLKQDGIEKVLQGFTDLPQINAVCMK